MSYYAVIREAGPGWTDGKRTEIHTRLADDPWRMTLRRAGRMHHLGIGTAHARKRVLAFADEHQITVADLTTGEVLSVHRINPNKTYWRNQNKQPGRWPSSPN